MTPLCLKHYDVRCAALSVSFAAHDCYMSETEAQADFHGRHMRRAIDELMVTICRLAPQPETFLVVDEEGTFREALRGQTRASVVEDIATGEYKAEQVLRLTGPLCEDVTAKIAADVLERLTRTGPGPKPYIPTLLTEHFPDEAEALRLSWMTPAERRAERDELNADHAYEAMRDRLMEAAE